MASPGESLTAADRDLLVKVRLAGLWEMPAGHLAVEKGTSPRVRQVGSMIGSQHRRLDEEVVQAAREVGVRLPDVPSPEQQGWLDELSAASGPQFDQIFVARLRAAHGKVFPLIANVRAGTRNAVVRRLAQSANGFVLTHLTLLESTNLVEYSSLPPPPEPPQPPSAAPSNGVVSQSALASRTASSAPVAPWYVGLGVAIAALVILFRRSRVAGRRRSVRDAAKVRPSPPSGLARPGVTAPGTEVRRLPSPYAPSYSSPYAPSYSPLLPPPSTDLVTDHRSRGPSTGAR